MTSPFGICPRELENTFPIQSYDVSTTGNWSQDEIDTAGELIQKYCEGKTVIANLSGGYLEACQQYVDETKSAIILSMESVFGTLFSILILHEIC